MPSLETFEQELGDRLGKPGSPPFLGHYELSEEVARHLRANLSETCRSASLLVAFRKLVLKWPSLTTAWVARHVREHYGEQDDQRFWPILAELFGREVPPADRPGLAEWFKWSCKRLELAVPSDEGRHVDRFVVQAGAPFHQLDVLVRRLLETERAQGLPDEDDDLACMRFASEAAERLRPTNPRLARILEADQTAWYVRQWVALRSGREVDGDPAFGEALKAAFAKIPERTTPAPVPQLVWAASELAIRVPAFRRGRLRLRGSRSEVAIEPLERAELVSMGELGPHQPVSWTFEDRGASRQGRIEPPAADGQEALFFKASDGALAGRGRYASPPRPFHLAQGSYVVVAAGHFCGPDGPAERWDAFSLSTITVEQDIVRLDRGSQSLSIAPIDRTRIELPEAAFVAVDGEAVFAGPHLTVRAVHAAPDENTGYELLVEADGTELGRVAIQLGPSGGEASLSAALRSLPARLVRCRVALVRAGERRALARTGFVLWNGLERVQDGRFVGPLPFNLDRHASRQIVVDARGVALRRDRPYAEAVLVFREVGAQRGTVEVRVPAADPVALVETRDERGRTVGLIIDPGQPLVVPPGDARMLSIRCPDPEASLRIGRRRIDRPFRRHPVHRLPLVAAAEDCAAVEPTITVTLRSGAEFPLARLTVPNEACEWVADGGPGTSTGLAFRLHEPLAALRLSANELLSGRSVELELTPDDRWQRHEGTGLAAKLALDPGRPPHAFCLELARARLLRGIWLVTFETRDEGSVWRAPSNPRGDRFAWLVEHELEALQGDLATALGIDGTAALFVRVYRSLRRCYSRPAWEQAHVERLACWCQRAAKAIAAAPHSDRLIAVLLPCAFEDPPSDTAPGWVPILGFWRAFPNFLALPASHYAELRTASASSARSLAAMAELAGTGSLSRWAAAGAPLAPTFLGCFANLAQASASGGAVELAGFDVARYREAILRRASEADGEIGDTREWAGEGALLAAARAFARKWTTVEASGGYAAHRPLAMTVVSRAGRWLVGPGARQAREHVAGLGHDLAIRPGVENGAPDALSEELQPAVSATALAARLEARAPGTLDRFLATLAEGCDGRERALDGLEFVWNLGRDSFAFWLLFWEMLLTTGDRHA